MSAPESENKSYTGPQKAAILIMYLEREVSKHLLGLLTNDEVRAVGLAMATIDRISQEEVESVVADFIDELKETTLVKHSGPDFVKSVLPELVSDERKTTLIPVIHRRVNKEFEEFIQNRQPGAVAALLKEEQPQVQAVALSLMGPENAANVLKYRSTPPS